MDERNNRDIAIGGGKADNRAQLLIPIGVLIFISVLIWLAMRSTEGDPIPRPTASQYSATWTELADGSHVATVRLDRGDAGASIQSGEAMRCWPQAEGFDCLAVYQATGAASLMEVRAERHSELPTPLIGTMSSEGYTCGTVIGSPRETIGTGKTTLTSNELTSLDDRWSRQFVTKFMADNNVKGRWFDCLTVLREVSAGSLETLGTTLITKGVLPPT